MATLDLTLDSFEVPALSEYIPPFGHKKQKGGLSTQEVNNNVMMAFMRQRPLYTVTEDSFSEQVQADCSIVIQATSTVTVTLGSGAFIGVQVTVFNSGGTVHLCAGHTVPANGQIVCIWNGSAWVRGESLGIGVQPGTLLQFAGTSVPSGWLLCDGSEVSRVLYSDLYSAIGDDWGTAATDDSFVLPDLRECVPVGAGENTTAQIANHDVYAVGEFKDDQLQEHQHKYVKWNFTGMRASGDSISYAQSYTNSLTSEMTGRIGTTTHGKQVGVNYVIKY